MIEIKHPSGVQPIVMSEVMEFNTGTAFMYLFGTHGSSTGEDLRRALWFVNREYDRLDELSKLPVYILRKFQSNVLFTEAHEVTATKIVEAEGWHLLQKVFTILFDRVTVKERRVQMLGAAVYIETMIKEVNGEL